MGMFAEDDRGGGFKWMIKHHGLGFLHRNWYVRCTQMAFLLFSSAEIVYYSVCTILL